MTAHRISRPPSAPRGRGQFLPPLLRPALALLTIWGLAGCGSGSEAEPPPPPVVEVATPTERAVTEYFHYTGSLESVATVEIRARVSGFLEEVLFQESTNVEAGDVLFTIEKAPYEVEVRRAEAELARMEAAQSLAEARLARVKRAAEANAANELEVIEVQAEVDEAAAEVHAAEERLNRARLDLSYTDVRTPIAGRVDRNYVDAGNLVGSGEPTLLARVVTMNPVRVSFDISETIALRYLSSGDDGSVDGSAPPVAVGLADEEGFPHPGVVDFVDNVLDSETGTLRVRAQLPNPTGKLYPGLFARIRVPWEVRENTVVIHEEAVGTGLEGKYVLTLGDGDVVARRPVTLGERLDDGTIAVTDGLSPDERYIVRGLQKARPGAPVTPRPFQPAGEEQADGRAAGAAG